MGLRHICRAIGTTAAVGTIAVGTLAFGAGSAQSDDTAVSYTHLDVYKRQLTTCPSGRSFAQVTQGRCPFGA